jgi:colicin import membrane protein
VGYLSRHKEGIIFTILFHALVLIILLNLGFLSPSQSFEEKGMLIDFGMSDEGMGKNEPAPANVDQQEENIPVPAKHKKEPVAKKTNDKEKIVTQDFEKTAVIEEQRKQEAIEKKKKILEEKRERDSIEQINQERIAEQNRLAEIRRQDSIQKARQNAQIAQINSRAKNAFGVSGLGTDPNSPGQGTSNKPGNQGSPDGIPGGGLGGSGNGNGIGNGKGPGNGNGKGTEINFSLSGRKAKSLPKPSYPGNEEGIVVVKITVDKNGKVTQAEPGAVGTKTPNQGLWEAARKAALSTTFFQNSDAPAFQTGTITYKFVLD